MIKWKQNRLSVSMELNTIFLFIRWRKQETHHVKPPTIVTIAFGVLTQQPEMIWSHDPCACFARMPTIINSVSHGFMLVCFSLFRFLSFPLLHTHRHIHTYGVFDLFGCFVVDKQIKNAKQNRVLRKLKFQMHAIRGWRSCKWINN